MLRRLARKGLLPNDHYGASYKIPDCWPFPMCSVDMRMLSIDIGKLRGEREKSAAELGA